VTTSRILLVLLALAAAPAGAAEPPGFDDLVRGATARAGFLDTYEKDGHLYLALPVARLGQEMVLVSRLDQGIGAAGLLGGTVLDRPSLAAFERHGDRLFLVKRASRFTAPAGSAEADALALSIGDSVLQSAPVLATRPDGAVVIDASDWLVTDLADLGRVLRQGFGSGPAHLGPAVPDRGRSWLAGVAAFPENLEIRVHLTLVPSAPASTPLPSLPDPRSVPLTVHTTFAALPATPMEPRLADDRIGSYVTARKDVSRTEDTPFVRYANRWRLTPGKPIVYGIERTVPERWRPWIKQGIEAWNRAFAAAGFPEALRAEDLLEDADPADLRVHAVRWITSDQPQFGGAGQSVVDPRTGEILDADILLDSSIVLQYRTLWKLLASPEARRTGTALPRTPAPDELIGQGIRWVVMHEVGHTLGLDHNFRGSAAALEDGVPASVMDYPAAGLPPLGQDLGDLFAAAVGPYDLWAISYVYTADAEAARQIARLGAQPGHGYGMEEHLDTPGALDPRLARDDRTADPVAWARQRAALYRALVQRLPALARSDSGDSGALTTAFRAFLSGFEGLLSPALRTVGGQYQSRDHVGDPGAQPPFVPVPRRKQEEALAFLFAEAFAPEPFGLDPAVLRRLGAPTWAHWGVEPTFDGRIDEPYAEDILRIQRSVLERLTDPYRLAAMQDAELKFGTADLLPLPELFHRLSAAVWKDLGKREIPPLRRGLQRAWLDRLTTLLVKPPDPMPGDARALARTELRNVRDRLAKRLTRPARFDASTEAHLMDVKERIDKALAAEYPAEAR
jgi:hypothetical protein